MLLIRSLVFFLGMCIFSFIVFLFAMLTALFPSNIRYKIISQWAIFNIWWLRITCNITTKVIGKENIPISACVIISNHQSTWESFAFQTIFTQQSWVLKRELLWIPVFGWGLALLKPIIINRGDKLKALKKVIKQGVARIQENIFVVIFPEGTRQPYGQLGNYQRGGIAIAQKAGCDICPIYHNAGKLWPKGSFIKYPGTITVVIGKPIGITGKSATILTQEVKEWTEKKSSETYSERPLHN
ncbi:Acyl-CoA:1-acyl-sn-glycerol-3-phosphate acyltransferase (EC [Bathymodiolus brooksi thiotrophic gill symbiont]|nr:Acyl-CoA:1-acyl-sn-glycerol-3-phosphate acyltransferase (EC [Bathymodiolus brooksi thiotrophic gill symbiont]